MASLPLSASGYVSTRAPSNSGHLRANPRRHQSSSCTRALSPPSSSACSLTPSASRQTYKRESDNRPPPLPLEFLPDLKLLCSPLLVLVEFSLARVLCLEDLTLAPKGVHVFVLKAHIVLASGTSLGFAATVRCVFLILLELDHLLAVFAGFRLE